MTAYTKTITGATSFIGGTNLYPDPSLYPSPDLYPYGGAILVQPAHTVTGAFAPVGVVQAATGVRTRLFSAVLQPAGRVAKASTRSLTGALSFSARVVGVRSMHALTKLLTAGFHAVGSLRNNRVLPPQQGGGGYGGPMPDSFFTRYKPTLRRQR